MLRTHGIESLVDIRRYPMSRRNPQFNAETLARALENEGIHYRHEPDLGGRRTPRADSSNLALKDDQFRAFADYMQTAEFDAALSRLIDDASHARTAVMCAEALPWRCHRSLLADALVARGVAVEHIMTASKAQPHALSPAARVNDSGPVTYPLLL